MAIVFPSRSFGVLMSDSSSTTTAVGLRRKMPATIRMLIPFETLLPTTKPSAKPNCEALLAMSWAVLPDHEARVRPLVEPVEAQGHRLLRLRERGTRKGKCCEPGGNSGLAQELSSRSRLVVH